MEMDQFEFYDGDDPKEIFSALVNKALDGKHSDFIFIKNYEMFKVARSYRIGTKRVFKVFKSVCKNLLKTYAKDVLTDEQKIDMLMAIKRFEMCYNYYKKEYTIAKDMLQEYRTYVFSGHVLDQFVFNNVRPDDDCIDYRKLPFSLF